MLSFAWQGITSFSAAPLRLITAIGVLVSAGSFGVAAWALWLRLFTSDAVPGWTSTVVPMYFLGGVQLLCIGIIGEYLAKIYLEVKRRPAYFVEQRVGGETATAADSAARAARRTWSRRYRSLMSPRAIATRTRSAAVHDFRRGVERRGRPTGARRAQCRRQAA